jgi:hypothetical protein
VTTSGSNDHLGARPDGGSDDAQALISDQLTAGDAPPLTKSLRRLARYVTAKAIHSIDRLPNGVRQHPSGGRLEIVTQPLPLGHRPQQPSRRPRSEPSRVTPYSP